MASHLEMHAISIDPVKARNLALSLLALAKLTENIFTDWELTFLRDIAEQSASVIALTPKERKEFKFSNQQAEALLALRDFRLTSRQAEKIFEIRDATVLHRTIGGVSVRNLINRCYEARLDLDESDEEWIERLWKNGIPAGPTSIPLELTDRPDGCARIHPDMPISRTSARPDIETQGIPWSGRMHRSFSTSSRRERKN